MDRGLRIDAAKEIDVSALGDEGAMISNFVTG